MRADGRREMMKLMVAYRPKITYFRRQDLSSSSGTTAGNQDGPDRYGCSQHLALCFTVLPDGGRNVLLLILF